MDPSDIDSILALLEAHTPAATLARIYSALMLLAPIAALVARVLDRLLPRWAAAAARTESRVDDRVVGVLLVANGVVLAIVNVISAILPRVSFRRAVQRPIDPLGDTEADDPMRDDAEPPR